tara:strand:+ start:65 stop:376 length:312 start_codon:yes stop_codon:yes gene_type:complete
MAVKLALLQSGDQIIADVTEVLSGDKAVAYLFEKPQKLSYNAPISFIEQDTGGEASVEVTLSNWITVADDDKIPVTINQVVALVNPIKDVVNMYNAKINAGTN